MRVAFVGHRDIENYEAVQVRLTEVVTALIAEEGADTFLFGSNGHFNYMCYAVVTNLKYTFPHIRRIYVRGEYDVVSDEYIDYLYTMYEDTFFPDKVLNAGVRSYVVRNEVMVDMCDVLLTYYDANYVPPQKITKKDMFDLVYVNQKPKSGTQMAVSYAQRKKKRIINLFYKT